MVDRLHALIVGDSGSGKTSLARECFHEADGTTLWVNHNGESGLGSLRAKSVDGLMGMAERSGEDPSLVLDRGDGMDEMGMAATAMEFCRTYTSTYRKGIRVFFDEAQHFLPDGKESRDTTKNPVAWSIHEGRDELIATTLISQTPRQLEYQPLYNLKFWCWCGPPAGMHDAFLSHNIASWIPDERLPEERHRYVVFNNRGEVLYEGETKREFS